MLWFWKVYGKLENNCLKICIYNYDTLTLRIEETSYNLFLR